ncbi:MAG TPA: hypothetical protein VJ875_16720 [Pyrinomonadaceae bacterium]|nr:hypothetical protein [Pyrinomonadaceae bacterium]
MSRGFYGVVYRAKQEALNRVVVLKVVPVEVYKLFQKDWTKECQEHAAIALGTTVLADINDQFDASVSFGRDALMCHIAVLEKIEGPTLETMLKEPAKYQLTARKAAQIAADLFEILHLFLQQHKAHNDLHPGNMIVETLPANKRRSDAIDPNTRAVAIDFGSMLDLSQSGDDHHVGDQHNAAKIIAALSAAVRKHLGGGTDVDYRIAMALRGLAEHLAPDATATRIMSIEDAKNILTTAMRATDEPWRQPLYLERYADTYNAQALQFWHVPDLWIDPEGRWLKGTTVRGPQVITGMRGCGKTMLLRALHFHARVSQGSNSNGENSLSRLSNDAFVGVYASCQKLLNPQNYGGAQRAPVFLPFERLFIAYLRDSVQVLRHLRHLDPNALSRSIDVLLRPALRVVHINKSETGEISDELAFEQFLMDLEFDLADGQNVCRLKTSPTAAFGHLADTLRVATSRLNQKYVLFLLDDVSTRFLTADTVRDVVSQLLFQHPNCGFRITTEAQTLHRVLLSPGGIAPADSNRDYQEFDLGNEVYRLLEEGSTSQNMEFIAQILRQRGKRFQDAVYRIDPKELLGDVSLEEIAENIASSSATSNERKQVYRGLRALQAICVGDIGDVVKLYEKILERADANEIPVPAPKQTDAFLEHSANLIHLLNRRDQKKKGVALSFAKAAGELLSLSGKHRNGRLRQYTKLYVRVEAGPDSESVAEKLLELLDAGVFVYDGGVPRTKTRDDDPVLQFKLSYKKILGLASFIGLADRDRFELSGNALRRWLEAPRAAHKILVESEAKLPLNKTRTRRPAGKKRTERDKSDPSQRPVRRSKKVEGQSQPFRSGKTSSIQYSLQYIKEPPDILDRGLPTLGIRAATTSLEALKERAVDTIILALGFEDRTLLSTKRLLETTKPRQIILVRYDDSQGRDIRDLVRQKGIDSTIISNVDELQNVLPNARNLVIDSSGLSKPYIFVALREALKARHKVAVVHTLAKSYYPSNEELQTMGIQPGKEVPSEAFSKLDKVLFGEIGPYELIQIHHEVASPERWRALLASASPKNDRLLHILDTRDYDAARILVPPPTTARRSFARAAAEFSASVAYENVALVEVDTNDILSAIQKTEEIYQELYFLSGANIEIGLTGSKVHAAAFAALAAAARISAAWYVRPKQYDPARFTTGVGETQCFDIWLSDSEEIPS